MQRREIGGDFHECEKFCEERVKDSVIEYLHDFSAVYFDSGRSALRVLLKNLEYKTVLLPAYICESVRDCFDADCNVVYYDVDGNLKINWSDLLKKSNDGVDIVYLHYFNGYIGAEYDFSSLLELKKKYNFTIIEDTTHSLFSASHTVGDYCVCSLRKWFPISDGGVLYSKMPVQTAQYFENAWAEKRRAAMRDKRDYLNGKANNKSEFLSVFSFTERALDEQDQPCCISSESYSILNRISCNQLIEQRLKNYALLSERVNCKQTAYGGIRQVPLFFTICVENRDSLRKYLIDKNIFCPIHWPLYDELKKLERAVINNKYELSVPIDQRYGAEDMVYISDVFDEYERRGGIV